MAYKSQTGFDFNSQRGINVASPSASTDATNKAYVDNLIAGLSWKLDVRAATTAAGTLASSFANASVIDGVTLATGDRILIKNQAAPAENGVYTVNVSGAPTRATDMDASVEFNNATVSVLDGTTQSQTSWTQTAKNPTVGTTAIVFAAYAVGQVYTAGNGLQLVTGAFSVLLDGAANSGLAAAGTGLKVNPGTGIVTSGGSTAVDFSVVAKKFSQDIGNGAATSIAVTHSLGTKDITWALRDNATDTFQVADVVATSTTVATFTFVTAPTTAQFRVTVIG